MEGGGLSEIQWIKLGEKIKAIYGGLMDACVLSCARFGSSASEGVYPSAKSLDSSFSSFKCKLDDFICGAYPMEKRGIGPENISLTQVFYGEIKDYRPIVVEITRKKPKCFTEEQLNMLRSLISDLEEVMMEIFTYPYLMQRFKTKENLKIVNNLKKRVAVFKSKIN